MMASIDKLFGTPEEYDIFYKWCQENIPLALQYFTPREYKIKHNHSMTLFPESVDMVLLEHCPIEFITEQIKDQYGLNDETPPAD